MASITLPIRTAVIANPAATVDELMTKLAAEGLTPKRDTVATIRSDTLATLQLVQQMTAAVKETGAELPTVQPKQKKARKRAPSRAQRWADAASKASTAAADLEQALEELKDMQGEFQDWKDNLPENLQGSALGEKLDAVCDLDIESAVSEVSNISDLVSEIEGADLPLGFGRD